MATSETFKKSASEDAPSEKENAIVIRDLRRDIRELKEKNAALGTNFAKAQKTIDKLKQTAKDEGPRSVFQTERQGAPFASEPESGKEHIVEWQPRYCPDCGDKNHSFKDEVECSKCGLGLGSEEYAHNKMKGCPNCGPGTTYLPVGGYRPKYPARGS